MGKLTKSVVEASQPREKQFTVWCSELKGFGVYVHPTGKRTYFVDYRTSDGARRRMTIGRHGAITTEQARKLAIETIGGIVLKKADPLQDRKTRRAALTVTDLCDQYYAAAKKGLILGRGRRPKKPSTLTTDFGRIERHIKPLLGSKLVVDLTRSDIVKFIRDVQAGKTAVHNRLGKNGTRILVTGGPGAATRTAGFLGAILAYAVNEGIIPSNPATGVQRPAEGVRSRRLLPAEYKALAGALSGDSAQYDTPQAVTGAWLIALTGCRVSEIMKLKWSEVDEEGQCFRLTDSKSGPSVRPVGREAFDVLTRTMRVPGNPYVLPALRKSGHYNGLAGAWVRFMERAGLESVTPHTMRHSYASVAGDLGMAESTIAALLGHAGGTVTSRYIHRLDSVLVAAANKVSAEIYRQMTGESGKVVALPRRA